MKRYSLLLLPLVAVVFGVSCRDTTSPAGSHALLAPGNPDLGFIGNKPPPPVDAAMTISVESPGSALFTGVYFSNGSTIESQVAAAEVADNGIFTGTAWLRLDNNQPDPTHGRSSANARFKNQDGNLSATGTLTFQECDPQGVNCVDVVYKITFMESRGDFFVTHDDCSVPFQPCAEIKFTAIDKDGHFHLGNLQAYSVEGCTLQTGDGFYFSCPDSGEP
jgi:hypothetical protein